MRNRESGVVFRHGIPISQDVDNEPDNDKVVRRLLQVIKNTNEIYKNEENLTWRNAQ